MLSLLLCLFHLSYPFLLLSLSCLCSSTLCLLNCYYSYYVFLNKAFYERATKIVASKVITSTKDLCFLMYCFVHYSYMICYVLRFPSFSIIIIYYPVFFFWCSFIVQIKRLYCCVVHIFSEVVSIPLTLARFRIFLKFVAGVGIDYLVFFFLCGSSCCLLASYHELFFAHSLGFFAIFFDSFVQIKVCLNRYVFSFISLQLSIPAYLINSRTLYYH